MYHLTVCAWGTLLYNHYDTEKMKNKNTHEMNELGLLGTHELYHNS